MKFSLKDKLELGTEACAFWLPAITLTVVALFEAFRTGWADFLHSPWGFPPLILAVMLMFRLRIGTLILTGLVAWLIVTSVQIDRKDPDVGPYRHTLHRIADVFPVLIIIVPQIAYHRRRAAERRQTNGAPNATATAGRATPSRTEVRSLPPGATTGCAVLLAACAPSPKKTLPAGCRRSQLAIHPPPPEDSRMPALPVGDSRSASGGQQDAGRMPALPVGDPCRPPGRFCRRRQRPLIFRFSKWLNLPERCRVFDKIRRKIKNFHKRGSTIQAFRTMISLVFRQCPCVFVKSVHRRKVVEVVSGRKRSRRQHRRF